MDKYITTFKALTDETRVRILNLILISDIELCACEFTDILNITSYNISKHLKILKIANLISIRKEGRMIFYSLRNNKDQFYNNILSSIQSIESEVFEKDIKNYKKQIKLRIDINKPIGIQKISLKSKNGIKCC
ncbi:MAG TPA: ArsR family transcriptional regulator [Flavobacteriia bacterium]|nr:ArsR family transcriptional regulator [Flavobacteriia bacterium]